MIRKVWLVLLCGALFFSLAAQDDSSYRAERFDVTVDAQPDGSLVVEESVTFHFTGGPFSYVFRELPTDHTDGITDIVAGADGVVWPQGTGPGQVEITGRNPIEVVWHLSPTSDATQTFELSYRPLGVVRRGDEADVLDWQSLPDEYDYAIDAAQVAFTFPTAAQLSAAPEVLAGNATVAVDGESVVFDMQDLSPGDPLVARLSFVPGVFTATPVWQTQQTTQNSRAWIWFVSGAIILIGGLFVLFRTAQPYSRTVPGANSYIHKPPLDLPPALAGYLANPTVGWHHGLATLFDLAGRGLITIEQTAEKSLFRAAEFAVTLLDRPQGLRPHEQALVDLLFTDKTGVEHDVVMLSEMGKLITSSRWKGFTEMLEAEAEREGLTNPAVKQHKARFIIWGMVLLLLALALLVAAFLLRDLFGMWPLVTVGTVALVGLLTIIVASSLSPLSDQGFRYATAFEPFRRFLKDVSRDKVSLPDPAYYEAYLPHATAYGFAEAWVKRQAKSDYRQIPAYFRAAGASGAEMAAFVAVISTASHSGGAAAATGAGAAGAGAAGGGASGAG